MKRIPSELQASNVKKRMQNNHQMEADRLWQLFLDSLTTDDFHKKIKLVTKDDVPISYEVEDILRAQCALEEKESGYFFYFKTLGGYTYLLCSMTPFS